MAGEPAEHWAVGIYWAALPGVVILQAKIAPWDGASPAREGFIVQPRVRNRPVEVFASQGLSTMLAIIGDPLLALVIPLRPNYNSLIGKEFGCLLGEPGGKEGSHDGVPFQPLGDVGYRQVCWCWGAPRDLW